MATDPLTIAFDTLRTLMGATAADPYIRAIERNIEREQRVLHDRAVIAFKNARKGRTRLLKTIPLGTVPQTVAVGPATLTVPARDPDNGVVSVKLYGYTE